MKARGQPSKLYEMEDALQIEKADSTRIITGFT